MGTLFRVAQTEKLILKGIAMAVTLNTGFLRTVNGVLKILEFCIVLVVLLIARFGDEGHIIGWCTGDSLTFFGIGCCVGFAIIVPAIILTYLLGGGTSKLEFIINLVGAILFIAVGASLLQYSGIQIAVGWLAIVLGVIFLIDFIYLCVKSREIIR